MRITALQIAEILDSDNTGLFKASNGFKMVTDFNPNDNLNTEGVYVTRPVINTDLQTATVDGTFAIYDEECVFYVKVMTAVKNSKFDQVRNAIENLTNSKEFCDYYSKTFTSDITHNETNITCEYQFVLNKTIAK